MDQERRRGAALLRLLHVLWLLPYSRTAPEGPTPAWRDELQNHTFQHTMYCQNWSPSIGLSEAYDGDQLFSFDFSQNTRVPRLPEFADWAQKPGDTSTIFFDKTFCQSMIQEIGPHLEGQIPVSRAPSFNAFWVSLHHLWSALFSLWDKAMCLGHRFPIVDVFTLKPLEFGKPNTLVCFVSNLFPPTLTVNWRHHMDPVEGIGPTFVSAVDELSFQAFSYLNFTPAPSDVFSCIVTHEIDSHTVVAYWVPHNALPSDLLENVLCGVAFGLGVLGIIVGLVLIIYFQKPCSGD
ncbi:HLA class II histocompatibility antigen, DM alpha chain isoform X2 [Mustela erminea]|uniref:HLA class II histocompatibility antigen, DM alpha chain isoform X2 n=1 Tax=Mustela erminea TaxID=36723 RepID=UPI00138727D0|nr:HLA class II histocompatibility antigen, DM alpha chain isoform X2 [Mustela erminea]